jgi:hypothetical protein
LPREVLKKRDRHRRKKVSPRTLQIALVHAQAVQVVFFWIVTPCSNDAGYPEDGGSKALRKVGILQHRYKYNIFGMDNSRKQYYTILCFLTRHHAMKAYWESGGIAPLTL